MSPQSPRLHFRNENWLRPVSFAVKIGLAEPDLEPRIQDSTPAYCSIGLPRSTAAATATVTATATAPVTIAIAASAMGTRMYIHTDKLLKHPTSKDNGGRLDHRLLDMVSIQAGKRPEMLSPGVIPGRPRGCPW